MKLKVLNYLTVSIVFFSFIGCSRIPAALNRVERVVDKNYTIGKINEVATGDNMVTIINGYMFPHYSTKDNSRVYGVKKLEPQQDWVALYLYKGTPPGDYIIVSKDFYNNQIGIIINEDGSTVKNPVCRLGKKGSDKRWPIISGSGQVLFEKAYPIMNDDRTFKIELLYNGKSDNNISIQYREYDSNLARQAFYQDLRYNLGESNRIRFKTIEIEVLSATNSEITYKILEDQNLPWLRY